MAAVVEMENRLGGYMASHTGGILAGQLKLKCGPWALHKKHTLAGWLKLNWVQVGLSHGVPWSRCPGWVAGADTGKGGSVLGCSTQGALG